MVDKKKPASEHEEGEQLTYQQFKESFKFKEHNIDCAVCTRIGKRGRKPSSKPHLTNTTMPERQSMATTISSEASISFQIFWN